VHDVRLAGFSPLSGVHPEAVVVCSLDEVAVGGRLIRLYAVYELINLEHDSAASGVARPDGKT
jgi:hypothetical protein